MKNKTYNANHNTKQSNFYVDAIVGFKEYNNFRSKAMNERIRMHIEVLDI